MAAARSWLLRAEAQGAFGSDDLLSAASSDLPSLADLLSAGALLAGCAATAFDVDLWA